MSTVALTASRPSRKRWTRGGVLRKIFPYLLLLPNMAIFATFTIYPAFNGFNMSLYESRNGRTFRWVGLGNYQRIFADPDFWTAVRNTVGYAVGFVLLGLVVAIVLAVLVNGQGRGKTFFRAVFFIPVLVSPVVVGLIWNWMLDRENGLVNSALSLVGGPEIPWLVKGPWAMVAIILVGVWMQSGFYLLILLAGLQAIDPAIYEASRIDGAGGFRQFWSITLPLLMPSVVVVVVLATIHGFQSFDFIWTLTGGGPLNATLLLVQYIYQNGFMSPISYGLATAGGVILFVVVLLLTLVNWMVARRQEAV